MTKEQLLRFIKTRNSSRFNSNLQFQMDAEECGFDVDELGDPEKLAENHYKWQTPHGVLIEKGGKLSLQKWIYHKKCLACNLLVKAEETQYNIPQCEAGIEEECLDGEALARSWKA